MGGASTETSIKQGEDHWVHGEEQVEAVGLGKGEEHIN